MRELDFSDGFTSASEPAQGNITANIIKSFANDGAFVADKGSAAAAGDIYYNTTSNVLRYHDGSAFDDLVDLTTAQTITGAKTFDEILLVKTGAGEGIDVPAAGDLEIGASVGANTITIGGASSTVDIAGDLTVSGTTTTVNTATLDVTDTNITVNNGGNDASSEGAGLTVERTGTDGSLIYADAATSKFKCGAVGSEIEIADISSSQVITNKDIDGATASNSSRITVPKAATATLNGLTRKEATIVYDTDTSELKVDNGTSLTTIGGSADVNEADGLQNHGLAASVAANELTVALKQANGSDPAAGTGAVKIAFRNSTITSGQWELVSVTSALSAVVDSGATLGHTSGEDEYVYVWAINNAGTVELAVSGTKSYDEGEVHDTTALSGTADSRHVLYSETARSGVAIRFLGRIKSNQATAGTWASSPSEIVANGDLFTENLVTSIELYGGSGLGSTNTNIRRFTTSDVSINDGLLISYASSSTLGDSFTCVRPCEVHVTYVDRLTSSGDDFGISVNSNQLTTGIQSITASHRKAITKISFTDNVDTQMICWSGIMFPGDVLRGHVQSGGFGGYDTSNEVRINVFARGL